MSSLHSVDAAVFWAYFAADRVAARLRIEVCNLADVLDEARRLSVTHTLTDSHGGFDILHVAASLECFK
jgi:hypothetical protein